MIKTLKSLFGRGSETNTSKTEPTNEQKLFSACWNDNIETVIEMIEAGADVNEIHTVEDDETVCQHTCLDVVLRGGSKAIADVLRANGALTKTELEDLKDAKEAKIKQAEEEVRREIADEYLASEK